MTSPDKFLKWLHRCWFSARSRRDGAWWIGLGLSLAIAGICGWLHWQAASPPHLIPDDARQHVFWMRRFLDPGLFPDDPIADYFQSVAPPGYAALYWLAAQAGFDPVAVSKALPPLLGLAATGFAYGLVWEILPVPLAGLLASALLNLTLWSRDDLGSGTPRAFVYPLFLGFLCDCARRSLGGTLAAIALLGGFYPQYALVAAGVLALGLLRWDGGPRWSRVRAASPGENRWDWRAGAAGLAAAGAVLLPYALHPSEFGPLVSAAAARTQPEFLSDARATFFREDLWKFWVSGKSSSFFPLKWLRPGWMVAGYGLLVLPRFPAAFPLGQRLTDRVWLLARSLGSATVGFFAAHALLFRLHLPGRYTAHTLRMVMALAAAIALTIALEALLRQAIALGKRPAPLRWGAAAASLGAMALLAGTLADYPRDRAPFPNRNFAAATAPQIYQYLAAQPPDVRIASFSPEADNLPSFARRSVLIAREYALPYHVGYYREFRQRVLDLLDALYTPDGDRLRQVQAAYGIDLWLLDTDTFELDYVAAHEKKFNRWLRQFQPLQTAIVARLERGELPVMARVAPQCLLLAEGERVLVSAACVAARAADP